MHPTYQRRGVGSALLAHAIAHADAAHRPIFIRDSSPAGLPLYVAHGFRQVDAVRFGYRGVEVVLPSLLRECGARERGIGNEAGERNAVEEGVGEEKDGNGSEEPEDAVLVSPGMVAVSEVRSEGSDEYVNVSPGQKRSP